MNCNYLAANSIDHRSRFEASNARSSETSNHFLGSAKKKICKFYWNDSVEANISTWRSQVGVPPKEDRHDAGMKLSLELHRMVYGFNVPSVLSGMIWSLVSLLLRWLAPESQHWSNCFATKLVLCMYLASVNLIVKNSTTLYIDWLS